MVLGACSAAEHDSAAGALHNGVLALGAVSADPNDLRRDLAKAFKFDWESAELSAKVVKGADPNAPLRTVIISVSLAIWDFKGLIILDVNCPGIRQVLDRDGKSVQYQVVQSDQTRCYDHRNWHWDQGGTWLGEPLQPFNVMVRLASDPKQSVASSISQLTGYIYAVYADDVIKVDIPFDPNYGWHEAKTIPDLMFCVDPRTPPCPGPLLYVNLLPADSRLFNLHRPKTPVPLYKYETWVKSKKGGPMMGLNDWWYLRDYFPFGDYAILRTELFDSKRNTADQFFTQRIVGSLAGDVGAHCFGQKEQDSGDTYDSIRHVIAVRPTEVKIPFVLKNIPIPKAQ
jgi:hypothetical protein